MTLVNARAAFEKAVTDAVAAADATVLMKYDNVAFTTPGETKKYILMTVSLGSPRFKTKAQHRTITPARSNATCMYPNQLVRQCFQQLASLSLTA